MTIPPIIPEIIPLKKGAPDANAMPRHNGRATKNTTMPDGISDLRYLNIMEKNNN